MSSKIAQKSNGKIKGKKVRKAKLKRTSDAISTAKSTAPRKIKAKAKLKLKSKPKADVLDTSQSEEKSASVTPSPKKQRKKKKRKSEAIKVDKPLKKKPKNCKKVKKPLQSCQNITNSSKVHHSSAVMNKPKRKKQAKARKRKQSLKIDSLKRQLMSNGIQSPQTSSAKKLSKTSPQKQRKSVAQVHSLKKHHHHHHHMRYSVNMMAPAPSISGLYGYGIDKKLRKRKRKTNDSKAIKVHIKKKEKVSDKKRKRKKEKTGTSPHKLKKKIISPSKTQKVCKIVVKTKTKQKELYVIGDYVHIDSTKCGIIRYKGHLKNVTGIWYGVELCGKDTNGDCDGVFNNYRYFECQGTSGIFVMYQAIDGKMKREAIEKKILKYTNVKKKKKKKKPKQDKNMNVVKKARNKRCDDPCIKKVKKKKKKIKKDALIRSKTMNEEQKSTQNTYSPPKKMMRTKSYKMDKKPTACGRKKEVLMLASCTKQREHDVAAKSEYNLRNLLDHDMHQRGRQLNKSMDTNHRRRTRSSSLSITSKDTSWMTHRAEKNSSDRIKESILAQKQVDLEHLIRCGSSRKKKKKIGKLFEKHIKKAQYITAKGGEEGMVSNIASSVKLKDRLKNEKEALRNAVDIVKDLGFLKHIKDNAVYSKIYIKKRHENNDRKEDHFDLFDMNNIDILHTFHGKTREILSKVICSAIVSVSGIEIVEMCNADINDAFIQILVGYLTDYYTKHESALITILSLQSNPISDRGMMCLTELIRVNNRVLNTIKLQNNRRDISTMICQQICESLQQNEFIIRFEFEFRHYQWRDFRDKCLKRNAEKARIQRLELQKLISF